MIRFHDHLTDSLTDIEAVSQHPDNPNSGDIDAIAESMSVNGVYAGVLAQKSTGYILAGNHRYAALLSLGAKQIPVAWIECDHERATRIMLADNRTTRLGRDNEHDLLALLKDLSESELGLIGTGFTEQDMGYIAEETSGFGETGPTLGSVYQVVADFTDEDAATSALDQIQQQFPDARMVYL